MLCRLCVSETISAINIFNQRVNETDLITMINKHFKNIKVKRDTDEISNIICPQCFSKLVNFDNFYFKVEIAQNQFFSENNAIKKLIDDISKNSQNIANKPDGDVLDLLHESGNLKQFSDFDLESEPIDDSTVIITAISDFNELATNKVSTREKKKPLSITAVEITNCEVTEKTVNTSRDSEKTLSHDQTEEATATFEFIDLDSNDSAEKSHEEELDVIDTIYIPDKFDKIIETSKTRLICENCKVRFQFFHLYLEHMKNFHKLFCFNCCEKSYRTRQTLANHITTEHTGFKEHVCDTCGLQLNSYKNLKVHWALVHATESEKIYDCKYCKEKFALNSLILVHRCSAVNIKLNTPVKEIKPISRFVKCPVCDASVNKSNFFRHKQKHLETYIVICDICGKKTTRYNISDHRKRHKGIYKKCEICNKSLKIPDSYRHHMKKHEEDRLNNIEYKCNSCNEIFLSNFLLTNHLKQNHSAENTNECRFCNRFFDTNKSLKTHITRTHTGIKCRVCKERGFLSTKSLQLHLLNEHNVQYKNPRNKK